MSDVLERIFVSIDAKHINEATCKTETNANFAVQMLFGLYFCWLFTVFQEDTYKFIFFKAPSEEKIKLKITCADFF